MYYSFFPGILICMLFSLHFSVFSFSFPPTILSQPAEENAEVWLVKKESYMLKQSVQLLFLLFSSLPSTCLLLSKFVMFYVSQNAFQEHLENVPELPFSGVIHVGGEIVAAKRALAVLSLK